MKTICGRLQKLEDHVQPAIESLRKSAEPQRPSLVAWIAQKLDEWGIVRGPNESLAQATARGHACTCPQLRN